LTNHFLPITKISKIDIVRQPNEIDRRRFVQILSIGTASLLTINPFKLLARSPLSDYSPQLDLIDGIKWYCRKSLGMELGSQFYTHWEESDGFLHYLYVSKKDKVSVPDGIEEFFYFGTDAKAARVAASDFQLKGYHTLVYRTAGTSATLLNKMLMSYPMNAIALIVFHEALHVHLRLIKKDIPLSLEEAAADVLAKYLSKDYQKFDDKIRRRSLKRTIKIMERIYKTINSSIEDLSERQHQQKWIFNRCYKRIKRALRKANVYQKTRFSYPINNAFFVRNSYYCQYYFELEKVYKRLDKSPSDFIKFVSELPNDLDNALAIIRNKKAKNV